MSGGDCGPASATRRVTFETLGCKLNQYESEALATELRQRGFTIAAPGEAADAAIVNSCTVTARADRKSRNARNRALSHVSDRSGVVVMTGCFVDNHGARAAPADFRALDASAAATPSVPAIPAGQAVPTDERQTAAFVSDEGRYLYLVDNARKTAIPDLLEAHFRGEIVPLDAQRHDRFSFPSPARIFHTRTTVKIQDGCDNFCTFCIIPFVRGRAQSRPAAEVVAACRDAVEGGARELVLTGVNMSRYRDTDAGCDFASLVERILAIEGDYRVRISSLEPDTLDERFVDLFRHPRMCPHLHLCLQSGSDKILLAMRRMYTSAQYRSVVEALRTVEAAFNVTTDAIVGFPGESEQDFALTLAAIDEHRVSHVHTFPFSSRRGTRAERMRDRVPEREITDRARRVRIASEAGKRRYRGRLVGRTLRVLVERIDDGIARGLSEYYVPVEMPAAGLHPNEFVEVTVTGLAEGEDPPLLAAPATARQR